jgi:hypothetical protein
MFAVERGLPSLLPPRNCASIEIGKSWSRGIVRGSGECSIAPELRKAHAPGWFGAWSPTKRYSTTSR